MNEQTLGQRIAAGRKKLGLSQEALGERMGVSRQAISKWESDAAVPELEKLIAMSRLFGVTLGGLLGIEEAPQSAGLNEEQIRSIVSQCQTPPPRPRRSLLFLCALACGLSLGLSAIALSRQQVMPPDYSAQIAALQQSNQSLQRELTNLRYAIDVSQQEDAETLLLDHTVYFGGIQTDGTAHIRFTATPKAWAAGDSAVLAILQDGQPVAEIPCAMDGGVCTAALDLPLENGYEYRFICIKADGSQQFQLLDDGGCADLLGGTSIVLECWNVPNASYRRGSVTVEDFSLSISMPWLPIKADSNLRWTEAGYALTVNGTAAQQRSLFDGQWVDEEYETDLNMDFGALFFEDVALAEGDRVALVFHASLSNGMSESLTVANWVFHNGGLIIRD